MTMYFRLLMQVHSVTTGPHVLRSQEYGTLLTNQLLTVLMPLSSVLQVFYWVFCLYVNKRTVLHRNDDNFCTASNVFNIVMQ